MKRVLFHHGWSEKLDRRLARAEDGCLQAWHCRFSLQPVKVLLNRKAPIMQAEENICVGNGPLVSLERPVNRGFPASNKLDIYLVVTLESAPKAHSGQGGSLVKSVIAPRTALSIGLFMVLIAGLAQAATPITNWTKITARGSYVLTTNIVASIGNAIPTQFGRSACILVRSSFVTLDLAGYTIIAGASCARLCDGIDSDVLSQGYQGIEVLSGAVTNFNAGIFLPFGAGHRVEHIRAFANVVGIDVGNGDSQHGAAHRIIDNLVYSNGSSGILVVCPSVVLGNMAYQNGGNSPIDNIFEDGGNCTSANNSPGP